MRIIYLIIIAMMLVFSIFIFYRLLKGPSIYDRMNGMSIIGSYVLILIVVFGFIERRPDMFVDIAIAYAILGFLTSVVVAKYLGGKDRKVLDTESPSDIEPPHRSAEKEVD